MNGPQDNWEHLKLCKPALSPNTEFETRVVRDERWLVLRNCVNGDHIRLNPSASELLSRIDGNTSLEALCTAAPTLAGQDTDRNAINDKRADTKVNEVIDDGESEAHDETYTAAQICSWLGPLCYSGLVSLGSASEDERLIKQYKTQTMMARKTRFGNPLALKFPLHNPDRWLAVIVRKMPWLFSRVFLCLILCVIATALVAALLNIPVISQSFKRIASSPTHWWLYALMYPALKAIHELGHALVIKHWGGSVHETGITFLILMPIPYVDASDAWMFPSKYQRMLVGAAGMLAECTIAAIGLGVFLIVQPGVVKELGFAVFLMGSVSTLLFNANPLLKFDGYYILQDWLDIPNLSTRSQAYCRYLIRKNLFKVSSAVSPVSAKGERRWLLSYGVLASIYRCLITVVIALYLASHFLILGVLLAIFALYQLLVNPLFKLSRYLRHAPELDGIRKRSIAITCTLTFLAAILVAFMPMPSSTRTEGVVWVPQQAQVFAAHAGFVEALFVTAGEEVESGQLLMRLSAPDLKTQQLVLQAQLEQAQIEYRAVQQTNSSKAQLLAEDILSYERELTMVNQRAMQLDIVAGNDGQFVVEHRSSILGRHVKQGELLGYVVNKDDLMIKAVLTQQRIERVQAGVNSAQIRLADSFSETIDATLTSQTPTALNSLPSPALAYDGRSGIAVASQTGEQLKTLERVFHIELAIPKEVEVAGIGGRAYVTLHHQPESLGRRWWRSTRQLLLKQLTV